MNVNRIFCIGKNYAEHVSEMGHVPDGQCLVFMKPPTSVVPPGPLTLPRDRGSVHHETEMVVMLTGGGANVPVERALEHVGGITLGLDLTLRDLQADLKKRGAPWELCKSFDASAPLGAFTPYQGQDLQALEFRCTVNGALRQSGRTQDMLFPVARLIHILSKTWALQAGDIIYTGTPAGVGPLAPADRVTLESPALGRFEWQCR